MGGSETGSKRAPRLRTKPFDDKDRFREALQEELRKSVSPSIVVVKGDEVGKRTTLARSIEVGRDPDCDLPVVDENVSWRHFRIEDRGGGELVVVDLGSTNGTLVNEVAASETPLKPGD